MKGKVIISAILFSATLLTTSCSDGELPKPNASNSLSGVLNLGFWNDISTREVSFTYPNWKAATSLTLRTTETFEGSGNVKELNAFKINLDQPVATLTALPYADYQDTYDTYATTITDALGNVRTVEFNSARYIDTLSLTSSRYGQQVVAMTDNETSVTTFYLIGGTDQYNLYNDCWKSLDGVTWIPLTYNAAFSPRQLHRVVVMPDPGNQGKNTMWLVGGNDGIKSFNDVYKSVDGITWEEVKVDGTAFTSRYAFSFVTMKDPSTGSPAMYVIGGRNWDGGRFNEIWKSANGSKWTKVTTTGSIFSARAGHQSVVTQNAIWVVGGFDGTSSLGDVWKSTDGVAWTKVTAAASFGKRFHHQLVVFKGDIYLVAGADDAQWYNEVWSSGDGASWTKKSDNSAGRFQPRYLHQVAVGMLGDTETMWVFGGEKSTSKAFSDVWKTTDGAKFIMGIGSTVVF